MYTNGITFKHTIYCYGCRLYSFGQSCLVNVLVTLVPNGCISDLDAQMKKRQKPHKCPDTHGLNILCKQMIFFFQIRVTICNNSFKTFFLYTVVSIEHDLNFTLMGTRKQWTTVAQILIKYSKHI